jgi:hypothetical protein
MKKNVKTNIKHWRMIPKHPNKTGDKNIYSVGMTPEEAVLNTGYWLDKHVTERTVKQVKPDLWIFMSPFRVYWLKIEDNEKKCKNKS